MPSFRLLFKQEELFNGKDIFIELFLHCTVKTRPVTIDRVRYISHRFSDGKGIFIPHFYMMLDADLQTMKKKTR